MKVLNKFAEHKTKTSTGQKYISDFAKGVSARCWYRPATKHIPMIPSLALVFAEVIDNYIEALQWCSGSGDFQVEGKARKGWNRLCVPLIKDVKKK